MEKNKKNINLDNKKLFIISLTLLIGVIVIILFASSYFRDFGKIRVSKNNKKIFTVSDLTINNLKFNSTEKQVKKELGKPKKEETKTINDFNYKILSYDGATITLKEFYNDFSLVKVEVTSNDYVVSRKLKVGNRITKAFRSFKVEQKEGAYLYGNYKKDALTDETVKKNIYFGVRSSKNVLYVNRDAIIDNSKTNIAKLDISYKKGVIKKITWSYDIN